MIIPSLKTDSTCSNSGAVSLSALFRFLCIDFRKKFVFFCSFDDHTLFSFFFASFGPLFVFFFFKFCLNKRLSSPLSRCGKFTIASIGFMFHGVFVKQMLSTEILKD